MDIEEEIRKKMDELVSQSSILVASPETIEKLKAKGHPIRSSTITYKDYLDALFDKRRKIAHEALLSQLYIVNRALLKEELLKGKVPIGGIYSLNPDTIRDRNSVSDWAGYLVKALARRGFVKLKR